MVSPRSPAQESQPAEKRATEININSATGQPYVVYEGTILETVLMNRLDGDAVWAREGDGHRPGLFT